MHGCLIASLVIFIVTNVIHMIIGGFMCITAMLTLFMPQIMLPAYKDFMKDMYRDTYEVSKDNSCYADSWADQYDDSILTIFWMDIQIASVLLAIFAGFGGWLFIASLWGLIATLSPCIHKALTIIYMVCQGFLMLALPICYLLIYLPFYDKVLEAAASSLINSLQTSYYATEQKLCHSVKLAFDALQYQAGCCGIFGYDEAEDSLLAYSNVCRVAVDNYRQTSGCFFVLKRFLDRECMFWLGIAIGIVCFLMLVEVVTAIILTGLWKETKKTPGKSKKKDKNDAGTEAVGAVGTGSVQSEKSIATVQDLEIRTA